jgi:hypothetical protein
MSKTGFTQPVYLARMSNQEAYHLGLRVRPGIMFPCGTKVLHVNGIGILGFRCMAAMAQ